MKSPFLFPAMLVSLLLTDGAHAANPPPSKKPVTNEVVILRQVDSLVSLLSDGIADLGPEPTIVYGPEGDAFVLFTMESYSGGNNIRQFLATFVKNDPIDWLPESKPKSYSLAALMEIGHDEKDWEFEAEDISVDKYDIITVKGLTWGPNDAHCCPSIHKTIKVQYSDYGLTDLGPIK